MTNSRLELTWANKDMRLLAHDDVSYEWVDPIDWRVSEVRLLEHIEDVGEPDSGNLLIRGDALHALTALASLPEIASSYLSKVKLCYIDPPFNTGEAFQHYDDALEHSVWLTMLRDRLMQIKKLLSPDGSVWVHLDDVEQHRGRSVLDEVFGADHFVATIVWQKVYARDNRAAISTSHDYIHVYSPAGQRWKNVRNLTARSGSQLTDYKNPDDDPRGPWKTGNFTASAGHATAAQFYEITLPSGEVISPSPGNCWRFTEERYKELLDDNRIWFGRDGTARPAHKMFLSEVQDGVVPTSWWTYEEVGHNQEGKREMLALFPNEIPFTTPKPERLIERIVRIATDPGDLVLDCFGGSGTTAAVSTKLGRKWVMIERSQENITKFIRPRLDKVISGEDLGGISTVDTSINLPEGIEPADVKTAGRILNTLIKEDDFEDLGGVEPVEIKKLISALRKLVSTNTETVWKGGGGFSVANVVPSMFEEVDGIILLSEWAVGGELAKAVCAQVRYSFAPDAPFAGHKGRSKLAVIDGMLTTGVVDYLAEHLDEKQTVLVYAQALEPGIQDYVRTVRPGSRARKIPRDLAKIGPRQGQLFRLEKVAS